MIARLLISNSQQTKVEEIGKILSEAGLKNPHPDLLYFLSDSKLGIGEARQIKEHFSFKPLQAKGRGVVLEDASSLTLEAQNALLKTLEEPPPWAVLILAAPSESTLLPTILSRCQIVILSETKDLPRNDKYAKDLKKLLESNIESRFEYIEKLEDREGFLQALIGFFRQLLFNHAMTKKTIVQNVTGKEIKDFLEELLQAEKWHKQNVSIRAILEYLMLVIPSKVC